MVKFNKKTLLNDISKTLARLNGTAIDPDWGKHIATAEEGVQYFLIARELKFQYPNKYTQIFIDEIHEYVKDQEHGVMTNKESSIYKNIPNGERKSLGNIDMLIEYADIWLLIQFKLLRPMGGTARRFDQDFFYPLLLHDKFDSSPNSEYSSIPNDILKFNKIRSKSVDGKNIKKLVIAIYYPSNSLWPNAVNKLRRLQEKEPDHKSKIKLLERLLKKCVNRVDIRYYLNMLNLYDRLNYEESREVKIKPMSEFESIKPNVSQSKWNFSEFFHKKLKLLSWEIRESAKTNKQN